MPVKEDEVGRRYVEAEVEVPGSPEDVWRAIATAEGVSSWFMPTKIERDADGNPTKVITTFGPGMDSVASIRRWNPPESFTAEAEGEPGTIATEWIVEARKGGTCVVRVVHRWFADSDDWDGEFEGHAYGWATSFFRILSLYLTYFAGQESSDLQLTAFSRAPAPDTWRTLKSGFKIDEGAHRFTSMPGAPEISGALEQLTVTDPELRRVRERAPQIVATLSAMDGEEPDLFMRLDRPAPGIAHLFVMPMGQQTMVAMRLFFYGAEAARVAREAERRWNEWLGERFPQETSA